MKKRNITYVFFLVFLSISAWTLPTKAESCRIYDTQYGTTTNCKFPENGGVFQNSQWEIAIGKPSSDEFTFMYRARNLKTGRTLALNTSEVVGTTQRVVYIFRKGSNRYIVTVRPSQPTVIRLEIYEGNNLLVNQLLNRVGGYEELMDRVYNYSYSN